MGPPRVLLSSVYVGAKEATSITGCVEASAAGVQSQSRNHFSPQYYLEEGLSSIFGMECAASRVSVGAVAAEFACLPGALVSVKLVDDRVFVFVSPLGDNQISVCFGNQQGRDWVGESVDPFPRLPTVPGNLQ